MLGRLCFCTVPPKKSTELLSCKSSTTSKNESSEYMNYSDSLKLKPITLSEVNDTETETPSSPSSIVISRLDFIKYKMQTIEAVLCQISKQLSRSTSSKNIHFLKWKIAADVLDRLCLLFQVSLICLSVSLLLPR